MRSIVYFSVLAGLVVLPADFAQAQRLYRPNYGNYNNNFSRQHQTYRPDYYPSHLTPGLSTPTRLTRPGTIEAAIRGYYIDYLGREPEPTSLATWADHAYTVGSLREVRVGILASLEYFKRVGGDPVAFVRTLFRDVTGQPPQRRELDYWVSHFYEHPPGDRAEFVREMLAGVGQ